MTRRATVLFALLGAGCGAGVTLDSSQGAIVGGIAESNHAYVVSIGSSNCTGTLIDKHTVLTAGHCSGSAGSVSFGADASDTISVVDSVRHPMYMEICNKDALTYDILLLKLEKPGPSQAAPLFRETFDNSKRFIGPSWTFVGYGQTSGSGGGGSRRVATFPVQLIGPAPGTHGSFCDIPDTLIYYTASGRNTCNGDSGGPAFFVTGGVEYLGGDTSAGDEGCTKDGAQQRTDKPYIDGFIQAQIDKFEANDHCRSDGKCDESCNTGGIVGDPDCASKHCAMDGICADACVAPRDPDCAKNDADNCGDNGICQPSCANDPDCMRMCGAEGNCIAKCPMPDPDCAAADMGGGSGGDGGPGPGPGGDGGAAVDLAPPPPTGDGAMPPPGPVADLTTGPTTMPPPPPHNNLKGSGCQLAPAAGSSSLLPLVAGALLLIVRRRRRSA